MNNRCKTYKIITFGCQMNFNDSDKISYILFKNGYIESKDEKKADIIIFNTCTVRENANQRLYGRLSRIYKLKKTNKNIIVCICGCAIRDEKVVEYICKHYSFVNIIFDISRVHNLVKFLKEVKDGMIIDLHNLDNIVEYDGSIRKYKYKASVNIMYGCDNFCSYCIIPYVKGRERSRKPEDIIKECKNLVYDGASEILLLGQNVNSYGKNLKCEIDFSKLLKKISDIDGLKRIRFMTSHPKDFNMSLIDVIKNNDNICNNIHLPLQSGSNEILKKMNRHYTKEQYKQIVDDIKKEIPNVSISTDIIVGFPGETEEDFLETLDVVRYVKFDYVFTFIYSKRNKTVASKFKDIVGKDVVKDRFNRLLNLVKKVSFEKKEENLYNIEEVLVENQDEKEETFVNGRTMNNSLVKFKGSKELIGRFVKVKLISNKCFYYIGEKV